MTLKKKHHNWGEGNVSYIEWDRDKSQPGFQFCHATGFNSLTYRKLLDPLSEFFHIRAEDARGHGFTETKAIPDHMFDWKIYCDDLIRSVESFAENKGGPILLGGHSMGGASIMQVAAKRPDLVSGIVLLEPVLISNLNLSVLRLAKAFPFIKSFPVFKEMTSRAESTLKRRRKFPSKEMIFKSYSGRGAFSTWSDDFLKDYINGGTKEINGNIELTCDPSWEAATFSSWRHNATDSIKKISCPITLLRGEIGSTTKESGLRLLKEQDPYGVFKTIKHSSHFLPMEYPEEVQKEILKIKLRIQLT